MNNAKRTLRLAALLGIFTAVLAPQAMAQVRVTDSWAEATPPGAKAGAVYLTLTNPGDEERKLLKIVSPRTDEITLHRSSMTAQGTLRMWPMSGLALAAGETLRMDAMGLHVMFTRLTSPLVAGEKIPVTIKFDGGEPEFTLMVEVRPATASAGAHAHH